MGKLGKTFTKKYNFKRLLQTAPDLSNRYKRHEDAINSIEPIKHIRLITYENRELVPEYNIESVIDINAVADIKTFGPGFGAWPKRIKYAEQVLDLRANEYHVWAVEICGSTHPGSPMPNVEVSKFTNPAIAHHYPVLQGMHDNHKPIFNQKKLSRIDQNDFASYFLVSVSKDDTLTELRKCGIVPDGHNIFGAAFYHRDIAYLYAESLRKQMEEWPAFRKQRI